MVASITLLPACALAHAHLLRSSPVENAVLDKSPAVATLVFAEPVTLTAVKIESKQGVKTAVKPSASKAHGGSLCAAPTARAGALQDQLARGQ